MHCTSACKARHSSKRTSDARPYGSDEEQRETNLSGASRQLPLGRGAYRKPPSDEGGGKNRRFLTEGENMYA